MLSNIFSALRNEADHGSEPQQKSKDQGQLSKQAMEQEGKYTYHTTFSIC